MVKKAPRGAQKAARTQCVWGTKHGERTMNVRQKPSGLPLIN
jgi:hypothetical protein